MSAPSLQNQTPLSATGQGLSLCGLRVARNARSANRRTLDLAGGGESIELNGLLALPGLINAHDHLEFALFPRLGEQGAYRNARQWAEAIYRPDEPPIRDHLRVPKPDRLHQGGLRNLLGGVTTVCHHNPYEAGVFEDGFPVRVVRGIGWAHSLSFEDDVAARFAQTPADRPFVIHAGEGTDEEARGEIDRLDALGALTDRTVLVHAAACGPREWDLLRDRGCGVVWCPSSNLFLFGRTIPTELLHSGPPVALGTDSPLTAAGGMFEELACARSLGVAPEALYEMVTATPARMLRLAECEDDWILLEDRGLAPCEALIDSPSLEGVLLNGRPKLLSERLALAQPRLSAGLRPIHHGGRSYRAALGPERAEP